MGVVSKHPGLLLVGSLLGAALLYVLLRSSVPAAGPLQMALCNGVLVSWALASVLRSRRGLGRQANLPQWLSAGSGAVLIALLLLLFRDAHFGPGGYATGDAKFMVAQVVKGYWYAAPVDFNYRGLSSFYPPLYPFVIGRLAALLHVDPNLARQLGAVATLGLLVPAGYLLWSPHIGRRAALVLMLFVAMTRLGDALWKPYEYASSVLFCPLWLNLMRARQRALSKQGLLLAAMLAALFCAFYYAFFIAAVDLIRRLLYRPQRPTALQRIRIATTLGLAAALSSVYWLPLAIDLLANPFASMQNRWFVPEHVTFTTLASGFRPMLLLGFGGLLLGLPGGRTTRALGGLALSCALWMTFTNLMAAAGMPLLGQRTWPLLTILLQAAGFRLADQLLARLRAPQRRARLSLLLMWAFGIGAVAFSGLPGHATVRDAVQEKPPPRRDKAAAAGPLQAQGGADQRAATDHAHAALHLPRRPRLPLASVGPLRRAPRLRASPVATAR